MPSRDSRRAAFELALRVLGTAAMLTLVIRLWFGATDTSPDARATSVSLDSALASWSMDAPRGAVVHASNVPNSAQRDWLVALRRTGTRLSWSVDDSSVGAMVIEPGPRPEALARLAVVGRPRSIVRLSDNLGRIDSLRLGLAGAAAMTLRPLGTVRASLGSSWASAAPRDSLLVKPVLLIGSAGWETKFVAAALEEAGWTVNARVQLAPGTLVRQGNLATLDTMSYGALVVIDSVLPLDAGSVQRFVNDGGGLVASGPGVRHPALRSLLPQQTREMPGTLGGLLGATPRSGLSARGFVAVLGRNVVFERRNGSVVIGATRVGAGRVIASGYDDTWRLRLVSPNENAPREHREWWSSLVGSVTLTRVVPGSTPALDEAPFAATVAALGPPLAPAVLPSPEYPFPWDTLLAGLAGVTLLVEWLSRRLRGVA